MPVSSLESTRLQNFISIAVHDLREPLRAIRTGSELLAIRCAGDESVTRNLSFVQEGVDRLELLIRDIAQYCYEEAREHSQAPVPLERALSEARDQLSGGLEENQALVTHGPLPVVAGDAPALALLFRCLLDNACKFRGDAPPRIRVSAASRRKRWIVSVRDNGTGFKPEYCEKIFQPFEKLHGKRYVGSGLGLALAKRIVERHGGRIAANANPGQGAVFTFSLPPAPIAEG